MSEEGRGSAMIRWDLLTIGHLSRNRYWGEADDQARRGALCTSTLLRTPELTVVIDPALPPEEMARILDERAGIAPSNVDLVFLTHFHGDHRAGLGAFPDAEWRLAPAEIEHWRRQAPPASPDHAILDRVLPAGSMLIPGVVVIQTPGHTHGHSSLLFESEGMQVAVAGDAVMTRDFFRHRDYYFNTVDPEAAVASIEALSRAADIIVAGHDNYFLNQRHR